MTASRRRFLGTMASFSASAALIHPLASAADAAQWRMPDESEPHKRTWMAFGAQKDIWGGKLLPEVQRNLATIALSIARFEPVSMLVRQEDHALARKLMGSDVELIVCPLDDLWMRDMGPVFVKNTSGEKAGVDFNFNGWGDKQQHRKDKLVSAFVSKRASVPRHTTSLVLEGGGIEVDGHGTAIITESCVLNDNRNPGVSKARCEAELARLMGIQKVIWLPGIKGQDITDGHTDFYARFAPTGSVIAGFDPDKSSIENEVTSRHLDILKSATNAQGKPVKVAVIESPSQVREAYDNNDFAAGYINFYVCNGAVIASQFGDPAADSAARDTLKDLFPKREIVQIAIDGISAGGGGIHCTTQQEPA